jgi:hypothetical protein
MTNAREVWGYFLAVLLVSAAVRVGRLVILSTAAGRSTVNTSAVAQRRRRAPPSARFDHSDAVGVSAAA